MLVLIKVSIKAKGSPAWSERNLHKVRSRLAGHQAASTRAVNSSTGALLSPVTHFVEIMWSNYLVSTIGAGKGIGLCFEDETHSENIAHRFF